MFVQALTYPKRYAAPDADKTARSRNKISNQGSGGKKENGLRGSGCQVQTCKEAEEGCGQLIYRNDLLPYSLIQISNT